MEAGEDDEVDDAANVGGDAGQACAVLDRAGGQVGDVQDVQLLRHWVRPPVI